MSMHHWELLDAATRGALSILMLILAALPWRQRRGPALGVLARELLDDPPGFDRSQLAVIDQRVVGFFDCQLRSSCASSQKPGPTPRDPT
ncbi:MAG: hypothetical protein JO006_08300 [Paucibacter sp.]|nr:hypothetical protein [Roseateles sp.]